MKRIVIGVVAAASLVLLPSCSSMNQHHETCTVIGKEAVNRGDAGNQYRVYTDECETLVVEDTLTEGRWDSADFYAKIETGKKYDFLVGGYRIGAFSEFPNILELKEVK